MSRKRSYVERETLEKSTERKREIVYSGRRKTDRDLLYIYI